MRYPLSPLLSASGLTEHALFLRMGTDTRVRLRASQDGLTERQADRWACALGLHPEFVWENWLEDHKVPCENCAAPFMPTRKGHRFCSYACRDRKNKRDRWATDPEFRARRQAYLREYRASAAKVIAAQKRQWWEQNRELVRQRNREGMRRLRQRRREENARGGRQVVSGDAA